MAQHAIFDSLEYLTFNMVKQVILLHNIMIPHNLKLFKTFVQYVLTIFEMRIRIASIIGPYKHFQIKILFSNYAVCV